MPYERFNKPNNTTSIDDLESSPQQPVVDKFIRSSHSVPQESGMFSQPMYRNDYEEYTSPQPPQKVVYEPIVTQRECICPDVYLHIMNCPVCKKIYGQNSTNTTIYIMIIVILLVFCALLFKKAFP